MVLLPRLILLIVNLFLAAITVISYKNEVVGANNGFGIVSSQEEGPKHSRLSSTFDVRRERRRLDDGSSSSSNNQYDWISTYSLQFQGCHNSLEYHHSNGNHHNNNNNNNNKNGAKIYIRRLVRFQLCYGCSSESDTNSTSFYCPNDATAGEYVVDMRVFLKSFVKAQMASRKATCQAALANCGCSNNYYNYHQDGDTSTASTCSQQCFNSDSLLGYCLLLQQLDELDFNDLYLECTQIKLNNRQYYIGPSCSSDGSRILLSLFTDNSCSVEATSGTWAKYNNNNNNKNDDSSTFFKYFSTGAYSIVGSDCVSCAADSNDDNYNEGSPVKYMCESLYQQAGKCEQSSSSSYSNLYSSTDACNFIEGIKMTSNDGRVVYSARPSKSVGTWIGIFAISTILLGVYVYYLQVKVHRVVVQLNNDKDPITGGITSKNSKYTSSDDDSHDMKDYYYT